MQAFNEASMLAALCIGLFCAVGGIFGFIAWLADGKGRVVDIVRVLVALGALTLLGNGTRLFIGRLF
jgi:hypothetical protein